MAQHLVTHRTSQAPQTAELEILERPSQHTGLPRVQMGLPLRGIHKAVLDPMYNPATCVGRLVDSWTAVNKVPGHKHVGHLVSDLMDRYFDVHPDLEDTLYQSIGSDNADVAKLETQADELRLALAQLLSTTDTPVCVDLMDTGDCTSCVRAHLLKSWLAKANDPALKICDWFWTGAPAGICEPFGCLDGLFPKVDAKEESLAPDELQSDIDTFANYRGIEDDSHVADALKRYREAG